MLRELYTNPAASTLNGSITNSATSITITDASTWPTNNFRIRCENEIMRVTSRSSNVLTVVRGQEGTTAASHADLTAVNHVITAGALDAIKLDLYAIMGLGRPPSSGNTYGDEFDDESFSGWTSVTSGSPTLTLTEQDKTLSIYHPGGDASVQWHTWMKDTGGSLSAGNSIDLCFRIFAVNTNFQHVGLFMSDGVTYTSGNQVGWHWSPTEDTLVIRSMTGFNTQVTTNTVNCGMRPSMMGSILHLRLVYQGSNTYDSYASPDGISWIKFHNGLSIGSMTPRYIGFGVSTWGAATQQVSAMKSFRSNF